ncbi:hypothetical protein RI367_008138 [Sorochytrium milnesiophthora]
MDNSYRSQSHLSAVLRAYEPFLLPNANLVASVSPPTLLLTTREHIRLHVLLTDQGYLIESADGGDEAEQERAMLFDKINGFVRSQTVFETMEALLDQTTPSYQTLLTDLVARRLLGQGGTLSEQA